MSTLQAGMNRCQRGVGLIELMISVIIGMLLVLVIYQIYEVSEGQKRTITGGSDAQQSASFGIHLLARDLSMAGNGIASSASALIACPLDPANIGQSVTPVPVVITSGATANDPDTITVFYGGSSTLSTPVKFLQPAAAGVPYQVAGPVGFSDGDVIVAVQGVNCTLSTINVGGVAVDAANGFATLTHTPVAGDVGASFGAANASLVNLGKSTCPNPPAQQATVGRVQYSVDPTTRALRTRNLLDIVCGTVVDPASQTVSPMISDVVNLKAQFGIGTDTDGDGIPDTITSWEDSNGAWWQGFLALPQTDANRLPRLRQLLAVRIAIVTQSTQYEKDAVTAGPLAMLDGTVSMTLASDQQHYRYKVLETVVPLRNALWNVQ